MSAAAGAPGAEGGDAVTDDDAIYDDDFCLTNGLTGEALTIPSANPKNFHQAISHTDAMPPQTARINPVGVRQRPIAGPSPPVSEYTKPADDGPISCVETPSWRSGHSDTPRIGLNHG